MFLSNIITGVASAAPSVGNSTVISLKNFSLNAFVPKKPFYTISMNNVGNIVAFGLENAISLSKTSLDTLINFYKDNTSEKINDKYDPKIDFAKLPIYKNDNGPTTEAAGDIFIDCQPVSESEETIDVPTQKVYDYGANDIMNSPVFLGIVVSLVIVMFLMLLRMGIKKASAFEF
jgi:hypothetical protein